MAPFSAAVPVVPAAAAAAAVPPAGVGNGQPSTVTPGDPLAQVNSIDLNRMKIK